MMRVVEETIKREVGRKSTQGRQPYHPNNIAPTTAATIKLSKDIIGMTTRDQGMIVLPVDMMTWARWRVCPSQIGQPAHHLTHMHGGTRAHPTIMMITTTMAIRAGTFSSHIITRLIRDTQVAQSLDIPPPQMGYQNNHIYLANNILRAMAITATNTMRRKGKGINTTVALVAVTMTIHIIARPIRRTATILIQTFIRIHHQTTQRTADSGEVPIISTQTPLITIITLQQQRKGSLHMTKLIKRSDRYEHFQQESRKNGSCSYSILYR